MRWTNGSGGGARSADRNMELRRRRHRRDPLTYTPLAMSSASCGLVVPSASTQPAAARSRGWAPAGGRRDLQLHDPRRRRGLELGEQKKRAQPRVGRPSGSSLVWAESQADADAYKFWAGPVGRAIVSNLSLGAVPSRRGKTDTRTRLGFSKLPPRPRPSSPATPRSTSRFLLPRRRGASHPYRFL